MKQRFNPDNPLVKQAFEIMRFGIVGVGATLTHLGVAFLLSHYTDIPLIVINIIAFLVAFGISFTGHYHWTFKSTGPKRESLIRFFIVGISGLAASEAILAMLIHFDVSTDFVKLMISIFIIPVVTYFVSKTWAFRTAQRT